MLKQKAGLLCLALAASASSAQLPTYTGGAYGDAAFAHDGKFAGRWASKMSKWSAPPRTTRARPTASTSIYRHHQFIAYWGGRFWVMHDGDTAARLAWSTNGLDWSPGDSSTIFPAQHHRMAFYVASNGRFLASHWIGVDKGLPGTRLIREIYGPNSYGTVYNIKTNYAGPYTAT